MTKHEIIGELRLIEQDLIELCITCENGSFPNKEEYVAAEVHAVEERVRELIEKVEWPGNYGFAD